MQAEQKHAAMAPGSSQISIKFGQISPAITNSINLCVGVDYCSQKIENLRFNTGQYLGKEIPQNSLLIILDAKDDAQDLANKLNEVRGKSESIKGLEESQGAKTQIVGKDKKVYICISAEAAAEMIQSLNMNVSQMGANVSKQEERWLDIDVKSNNNFTKIREIIESKGAVPAFFNSLEMSIKFNKTNNIKEIVKTFLKATMGQAIPTKAVDSFEQVNLKLQFESSSVLKEYPKLPSFELVQINDDFSSLKSSLGNKMEAYLFGNPLSLSATLSAEDLYLALDLLFA